MDNAASEPNEIIEYVWMLGVPLPAAQRRMSTVAQEACDGRATGSWNASTRPLKKGVFLAASDAEIKAMTAFFSINICAYMS